MKFQIQQERLKILFGIVVFLFGGFFLFYAEYKFQFSEKATFIGGTFNEQQKNTERIGIFSGILCAQAGRRPLALILAGDPEARPLSGISRAEMVIEIPVVAGGITRYLAFYQCNEPEEIGSIRSARSPFIGLAKGYGAIFGHWGGEKDALTKLRNGVIDNIDALPNPANAFWRKQGVPMPHDGFTNFSRLKKAAEKLTYNLQLTTNNFFKFKNDSNISNISNNSNQVITVGYPGKFQVSYHYKPETNSYLRLKGKTPEIDALTGEQIGAKNVVVLWANIYPTYYQYDNVELDGKEGRLSTFTGGKDIQGRWRKESFDKPLLFFDAQGKALEFEPGNIWVQVLGLEQEVNVLNFYD